MTDQMEKARLGSQPNLFVQSQSINLISPAGRRDDRKRDNDIYNSRRLRDNEGWRTATPAHTPLPHEYPQYERRRASDPVRCVDPSFNELKKLQQRFYSLNAMKPLPPVSHSVKPLRGRQRSQDTFQSSRSSIATNGYDGGGDFETNLNMKMIEDNEDVIIPDDMRQFLQQRQAEQQRLGRLEESTTPMLHISGSGSVEDWVQRTNSLNHASNHAAYSQHRQAATYYSHPAAAPPAAPPAYPGEPHPQYISGRGYEGVPHQPGCCGNHNAGSGYVDSCYANAHAQGYTPYQMHTRYPSQPYHPCQGTHPNFYPHQVPRCNHHPHTVCTQQCLMPPPPPQNDAMTLSQQQLQVRTTAQSADLPQMQYNVVSGSAYDSQHSKDSQQQRQQMLINQQLSPPCEVTSSTDRNQPAVRDVNLNGNILDNISSISAEINSQASQNFSSVSQMRPPPADSSGNMAISNMSNILSHLADENKYLNGQH